MAHAEQDDVDDDRDSGLGGGGNPDFGLDGGGAAAGNNDSAGRDVADTTLQDWLEYTRRNPEAEIPANGLSAENLARFDRPVPSPAPLSLRRQQSEEGLFLRLRALHSRSSEQQDTPQDSLGQGGGRLALRLRGVRGQSREQQDEPHDGIAQSTEQQDVASQDDPLQHSFATDASSDTSQDEYPLIDFRPDTGT